MKLAVQEGEYLGRVFRGAVGLFGRKGGRAYWAAHTLWMLGSIEADDFPGVLEALVAEGVTP